MNYKPHFSPGEAVLAFKGDMYVTTPLRVARRQMMAFGIMGSLHNSTEDCNTLALNHFLHGMDQFLAKCQVKFDLSLKVYTMFGGGGLIH